jgi:beta-glucuronidase
MVDNRALITKWPPCLGYFNYGGIHRDVTIEIMDSASLDDIAIAAIPEPNGGVLNINGVVKQATAEMSVNISCAGATKTVNVAPDGSFNLNMQIVDVNHWHPESPYLYPLKINLLKDQQVIDEVEEECGFRSMKVVDNQIILNGEIFKINGICYVYDSPTRGLIMTDAQIECDIALIKEMNCTMIRCHYPMSRKFYQACDRAGIMLWIEPNIYCMHPNDDEVGTAFADPEHCRLAKQMIIEMIANARNHPSVVFYGIGNECNTTNPEADKFFRMLTDTIRLHDSSRLVSYAALYGKIGNLADIVDVLGINSYWGWYDKCFGGKGLEPEEHYKKVDTTIMREPIDLTEMRKMLDTVIDKAHENTALLLTEFGADSVPGNLSNSRNLWSENYHADLLTEVLLLAEEYPQIVGTFPFCFSDYRDPSKLVNGYWNEINLKGVVDYNRNKKLAFSAMKSAYSKKVLDAKIQELPIELFSESR